MLAILVIEREPLHAGQLPAALAEWVQDAGMFAQLGLLVGLLIWLANQYGTSGSRKLSLVGYGVLIAEVLALLAYGAFVVSKIPDIRAEWKSILDAKDLSQRAATEGVRSFRTICLIVGGASSIFAILLPIIVDLIRLRLRRIWALARFTIVEVVRMRVLWLFSILLLIFLFPANWFFHAQEEQTISMVVKNAYWVIMVLLWITFIMLASFGLPTDMYRQTIHTVITKPVERFEIVLGRSLGYTLLMTFVLAAMTGCSLIYILARGVTPEAAQESLKARVTKYGDRLKFYQGGREEDKAINVGKVWEYRSYIPGPSTYFPRQHALWSFDEIPAGLATRDWVPCEFSFDVQRTTVGKENSGVLCSFYFITPGCRLDGQGMPMDENKYDKERVALIRKGASDPDAPDPDNVLAQKFGFYKIRSFEIKERRTQSIMVPGGLFDANQTPAARPPSAAGGPVPPLQVRVQCESPTQFVGMARRDLYLRTDNYSPTAERWLFAYNFGKGMFGIWCRVCLVIGVAVALSTYLSRMVTFLVVMSVYLGGYFRPFLQSVVNRQGTGGPWESAIKLFGHKGNASLEEIDTWNMAYRSDKAFNWLLRSILSIFPDLERFSLKDWVAAGFDISWSMLLIDNLLPLIGYVAPWLILGYYLMKWREIATS